MLANTLSQLGINSTLWIQLTIFVVFFLIVRSLYFKPFLNLILKRQKETSGVTGDAEKLDKEAELKEAEYQQKMRDARLEAKEIKDKILQESKLEANKRTTAARQLAKQDIEKGRAEIEQEAKAAVAGIELQVTKVSQLFAEKIMKTKAGV